MSEKNNETQERTTPMTPEEKMNELLERGKKKGKLTAKEMVETLEDIDIETEQIDKFYDTLENLGIEVTADEDTTAADDIAPPEEIFEEMPEEEIKKRGRFLCGPLCFLCGLRLHPEQPALYAQQVIDVQHLRCSAELICQIYNFSFFAFGPFPRNGPHMV